MTCVVRDVVKETDAEVRTGYRRLPRLHSVTCALQATFKRCAADFCVDEQLPFTLSGEGEHLWVRIRKQCLNTRDVMKILADASGCPLRDIGYSGLKDRYAITSQWFSLPVVKIPQHKFAGITQTTESLTTRAIVQYLIDLQLPAHLHAAQNTEGSLLISHCELLEHSLHTRKLRPGTHDSNFFSIVLRDCQVSGQAVAQPTGNPLATESSVAPDRECMQMQNEFSARLLRIEQQGFANYFGLQRFGNAAGNILQYQRMSAASSAGNGAAGSTAGVDVDGRKKKRRKKGGKNREAHQTRSMALSAARSLIFNAVLASRITDNTCWQMQVGEPLMLANSRSFFICEAIDDRLAERLASGDIQISGPLWGATKLQNKALHGWLQRESEQWVRWAQANLPEVSRISPELLIQSGLQHQRRRLVCKPGQLRAHWLESRSLQIQFTLPAGVFATALLRELCELVQVD